MSTAPVPTPGGTAGGRTARPLGALSGLVWLALAAGAVLVGCSGGPSDDVPQGAATPRGAVDAHVRAMRAYDLTAACELFAPAVRTEMALLDDADVDGYCTTATADVLALARDSDRARVERIYGEATVEELDVGGGDEHWFEVRSGDGTYDEQLKVVRAEGSWWVAEVISQPMEGSVGEEPPG